MMGTWKALVHFSWWFPLSFLVVKAGLEDEKYDPIRHKATIVSLLPPIYPRIF